jgi:hypothetical protein
VPDDDFREVVLALPAVSEQDHDAAGSTASELT